MAGKLRDGLWHGKVLTFSSDGQLLVREFFREGVLTGTSTWFHRGEPWQHVGYKDGLLDDEFYSSPPGGECVKGSFRFGELDGLLEVHWSKEGGLQYQANYAAGRITDDFIHHFSRDLGAKTASIELVDGVQNGVSLTFQPPGLSDNERSLLETEWINGKLVSCTEYQSDGAVRRSASFSAEAIDTYSNKSTYERFIDALKAEGIRYARCEIATAQRNYHQSWAPAEHERARGNDRPLIFEGISGGINRFALSQI